jgi:heme-degrading monooxygenase HmoA
MYVSVSRLRVPAERAPDLVAAFRRRARLVDTAEGFVDLQVWQSDRDSTELMMVSRWRDRAARLTPRPIPFRASRRPAEAHGSSTDTLKLAMDLLGGRTPGCMCLST